MVGVIDGEILTWTIALVIGVPMLVVVLSEAVERLAARDSAYAPAFRTLRSVFLPVLVLQLVVAHVLNLGEAMMGGEILRRVVETVFWFVFAITALEFVTGIRAHDRVADRWESRLPTITKTVARGLAVILPFAVVVTSVWNLDLSKFITAIGIGSVAIAFALQNTLSSVVSGILLALDKPFREGDWIEVDGNLGRVLDLNWRTTRLEVDGRDIVVIPNTILLDSNIRNYTVLDVGYRDSVSFGFAYKDAPVLVKDVAIQAALESPYVAKTPPPEVHLVEYGDSSLNYELHFHLDVYESAFQARRVRDDVLTRVFYNGSRAGLEVPFPIRTVRTTHEGEMGDAERTSIAMDTMRDHRIFGAAKPATAEALAAAAEIRTYGRDMPLGEIGSQDRGLGIILRGQVGLQDPHGQPRDRLDRGDVLGARYIVGRRPNTVRSVALKDTDILFIPGAAVDRALTGDAALARALHAFADARIGALDAVDADSDAASAKRAAE